LRSLKKTETIPDKINHIALKKETTNQAINLPKDVKNFLLKDFLRGMEYRKIYKVNKVNETKVKKMATLKNIINQLKIYNLSLKNSDNKINTLNNMINLVNEGLKQITDNDLKTILLLIQQKIGFMFNKVSENGNISKEIDELNVYIEDVINNKKLKQAA